MKSRFCFFVFVALLSLPALAQGPDAPFCGVPDLDRDTARFLDSLTADFRKSFQSDKVEAVRVPIVVHMITAGRQGNYPDKVVERMIDTLNSGFSGTPFQFDLVKINRVNNRQWNKNCLLGTRNHTAMTRRLAVNPVKHLNLYVCNMENGVIGMGTPPAPLPSPEFPQGQRDKRHSVLISPKALPHGEGDPTISTHGYVVVHEVGHYLGLWHTFQGGCEDRDQVADTPAQEKPTRGCATFVDSCPAAGADDQTNFMNYASDQCWDHFTPGQIDRMVAESSFWRPGLFN